MIGFKVSFWIVDKLNYKLSFLSDKGYKILKSFVLIRKSIKYELTIFYYCGYRYVCVCILYRYICVGEDGMGKVNF